MKAKPKQAKKTDKTVMSLAAEMGKARSTIYAWKEQGAPIEEGKEAVVAWAMDNAKGQEPESDSVKAAKLEVLRQTARRLKLANDEKERRLADKNDVIFGLNRGMASLVQSWDKEIKVNLPPALLGLDAIQISQKLSEVTDRIFAQFKIELERFREK